MSREKNEGRGHGGTRDVLIRKLDEARARYANEWSRGNAQTFDADGHYRWMAQFIGDRGRVLEIGVGDGSSTAALVASGCAVVGVDENTECLKLAALKLGALGFDVQSEIRGELDLARQGYSIRYRPPRARMPERGALLLEGDILDDPELIGWIGHEGRVDAIACWLMGTYQERAYNAAVASRSIGNPVDYRASVQARICRIADTVLRDGGIVHVVDRCLLTVDAQGLEPGSDAWFERCRRFYEQQAAGTELRTDCIEFTPYREPEPDAGPAIRLTRSLAGDDPDNADKAFLSIVYRRP